MLFLVLILLFSINTKSQNSGRFPLLRERILQAKLREIKLRLNTDPATFERFRPIYVKYEHEVSGIDFQKLTRLMKVDADSLSAADADLLIVNQLESARRLIDIREKYYKAFKAVLTPQQIIKLYQTEAELRKKVIGEIKRRLSGR